MEKKNWKRFLPILTLLACFIIGLSVGQYAGNMSAGILIGLGGGLIVMSVLRMIFFRKRREESPK